MGRYWVGVLQGAALGLSVAVTIAAAVWPEPDVIYEVEVVERLVKPTFEDALLVETPVIDSLMDDGWEAESDRQSDCLFDWLQAEVGWEITLDRVMAAGYWLDSLGGACEVMGR